MDPKDIDLIIMTTCTPDSMCPAGACWLQAQLGSLLGIFHGGSSEEAAQSGEAREEEEVSRPGDEDPSS